MTIDEARVLEAELRAQGLATVQPQKRYAWMIATADVPWVLGPRVNRNGGGIEQCLWVPDAAATIIMSGPCECKRVRLLQQGAERWGAIATAIVLGDRWSHPLCTPRHRFDKMPPAHIMLGFQHKARSRQNDHHDHIR